ncbi:MAG TPA: hypothetical protein VK989_17620 [Polyangia bacterium]|jgi:hypothetical protein|nr:hypothetical protein [Polyangia bacterium]
MRRLGLVAALVVCAAASCGGAATAPFSGRAPANHRVSPSTCAPRVATTDLCPPSEASSECGTDHDCVEGGLNGACIPGVRGSIADGGGGCGCVYDRCASDADCGGRGPCQCASLEVGNSCLAGNCTIDADCGVGGYCSPVADPCTGIVSGYWCHTSRDTCVDNVDCAGHCTYLATNARWTCAPPQSCPLPELPP